MCAFNKGKKSSNSRRVKRNNVVKTIFLVYFCVIALTLIWNLIHCNASVWSYRGAILSPESDVHIDDQGRIELEDDSPVVLYVEPDDEGKIGSGAKAKGVALFAYGNDRSLRFNNEKIHVRIEQVDTADTLAEVSMYLKDQTPYAWDDNKVYLPLMTPIQSLLDKRLRIVVTSEGLTAKGVFFKPSAIADSENLLAGGLYYEKIKYHPISPIAYFFMEAFVGLACIYMYNGKKMPFFRRGAKKPGNDRMTFAQTLSASIGKMLSVRKFIQLAGIIFAVLMFFVFVNEHTVKPVSRAYEAEFLVRDNNEEKISLENGDVIRQTITPWQNKLGGIAVRFMQDPSEMPDTRVEWKILDETGTAVLDSGSAQFSDLSGAGTVLNPYIKDDKLQPALDSYTLIPLGTILENTAGKRFIVEMSITSGEEGVELAACSETNGKSEINGGEEGSEICMAGLYANNGFLSGMFLRLCVVSIALLIVLFLAAHFFVENVACMYLICALTFGLVFSFMTPVYTISDERTHIDSIYTLSNRLLWINDEPGPNRMWKRTADVDSSISTTMPVTIERYRNVEDALFGHVENRLVPAQEPDGAARTAVYSRVAFDNVPLPCYLPGAVGFTVARILGKNLMTMIMAARWMNLLASVLVIFFAIRHMPFGGTAMAVIGLFPKTLQLMASCSYDAMIIAGSFVFISWCIGYVSGEGNYVSDFFVLILSGIFLITCKGGVYLPLLGLLFLVPVLKPGLGRKTKILWGKICLGAGCGGVLLFLGRYASRLAKMFSKGVGPITNSVGTRTIYSIADFIESPGLLIDLLANTINVRGDGIIGEVVGKNLSQKWMIIYAFIFLAWLGAMRLHGESPRFNLPARIIALLMSLGSIALIFVSMLIGFTSVDKTYIDGIQGRYLIPIIPVLFLITENGIVRRREGDDTGILYGAGFLLVITFGEILMFYLGSR